jgi:hypothetical protein
MRISSFCLNPANIRASSRGQTWHDVPGMPETDPEGMPAQPVFPSVEIVVIGEDFSSSPS